MTRITVPSLLATAMALLAPADAALAAEAGAHVRPAVIERPAGSTIARITLTDRAAQRLNIQTAEVTANGDGIAIVPYSAVLYDNAGRTWVYTNPSPLLFMRHAVSVARVRGTEVELREGPAAGTRVVTTGVPQLYGAEKGVGH
jgi:hypothetical protein